MRFQRRDSICGQIVIVVMLFKGQQAFNQSSPFAFGDADGEQDQHGVVTSTGNFNATVIEKTGQQISRNTVFLVFSLRADPWTSQGHFYWIEHTVGFDQIIIGKTVPALT